ncbi:hypothetical protein [Nocardia sp. NBC_01009]|uniref:hypothetical protein n=1 Tax=unclassified Nocardia TaxID=2637762 RepID=UPI003868110C|nr:hypothetical protein OHA42_27090 [Nocardia sp. NBC_01009]
MSSRTDLERELGGPLSALDLLSDQETTELLTMFRTAQRIETEGLTEAVDKVVGALPWPLRTAAKKIMFGNALG